VPVDQLPSLPPTPIRYEESNGGPNDASRARRLDWAKLLERVFAADVLVCPRCEGAMRPLAVVYDERTARKILTHLGLPSRAPPRGRARSRGQLDLPAAFAHQEGIDPSNLHIYTICSQSSPKNAARPNF